MSKTLSASLETKVATNIGTEPIILIGIEWPTGLEYYSTKVLADIPAKIVEVSGLDSTVKIDASGVVGDINITLDDSEGDLKQLFNTYNLYKTVCYVYQIFDDDINEKLLLFKGYLETPITWINIPRQMVFSITSVIEDNEIGFAPETGAFKYLAEDAIGKPWPIVFGSYRHVPCVKVTEILTTQSLTYYSVITPEELDELRKLAMEYVQSQHSYDALQLSITDSQERGIPLAYTQYEYLKLLEKITVSYTNLNKYFEYLLNSVKSTDNYALINGYLLLYLNTLISSSSYYIESLSSYTNLQHIRIQVAEYESDKTGLQHDKDIEMAKPIRPSDSTLIDPTITYRDQQLVKDLESKIDEVDVLIEEITESLNGYTYEYTLADVNYKLAVNSLIMYTNYLTQFHLTTLYVEDGERYPQNTSIQLLINEAIFEGKMTNNEFKIEDVTIPRYTEIEIDVNVDTSPNKFYIKDTSVQLKGMYCLVRTQDTSMPYKIIFIEDQVKNVCFYHTVLWDLWYPVYYNVFKMHIMGEGDYIEEAMVFFKYEWQTKLHNSIIDALNTSVLGTAWWDFSKLLTGEYALPSNNWGMSIGDRIQLHDPDYKEVHIANLLPSEIQTYQDENGDDQDTYVKAVFAFRKIKGIERLMPVPETYYTIENDYSIAGQTVTAIILKRPLNQYYDEDWDTDIYASLKSTVGPNTVDIIRWFIETYTDLSCDTISFNTVKNYVNNYPSSFVIQSQDNIISVIEKIAWQARCSIYIYNSIVYIKYLPNEYDSVITISEDDILINSLKISTTDSNELTTKFIATWKRTGAERSNNEIVFRNNVHTYGLHEQSYDFYIYDDINLVKKAAMFWMLRYSNIWKRVTFSTALTTLKLDPLDTVTIDLQADSVAGHFLGSGGVKGIVESMNYNPTTYTIDYDIWIPIRFGEMTTYPFAWPRTVSMQIVYPTDNDVDVGGAGLEAADLEDQYRPVDVGLKNLGDGEDRSPEDKLQGYKPYDYGYIHNVPSLPQQLEIDIRNTFLKDNVSNCAVPFSSCFNIIRNPYITDMNSPQFGSTLVLNTYNMLWKATGGYGYFNLRLVPGTNYFAPNAVYAGRKTYAL